MENLIIFFNLQMCLPVSVSVSARVESSGRHSVAQSIYRGVEEVLHTVRHPAQTFLPARDHPDGQTRKQQEVQC